MRVGHVTLDERPTGCTVVLAPADAVGAVDRARRRARARVETDLLAPENTRRRSSMPSCSRAAARSDSTRDAASMKFLEEQKIGYPIGGPSCRSSPAAILFDLNVGGHPEIRPDAGCGYEARARRRTPDRSRKERSAPAPARRSARWGRRTRDEGRHRDRRARTPDGLIVGAIVAVNAVGTVIDPRTGKAGRRRAHGRRQDRSRIRSRSCARRRGSPTARAREHDDRRRRDERAADQGPGAEGRGDGARRPRARHRARRTRRPTATRCSCWRPDARARDCRTSARIGALAAEAVSDAILRAVRAARRDCPDIPSVGRDPLNATRRDAAHSRSLIAYSLGLIALGVWMGRRVRQAARLLRRRPLARRRV